MGKIWIYKEEKRIFQAEGIMDIKKTRQVTCLDSSKFSLTGAFEERIAGMKLEKYVRARLSLLKVKGYSWDKIDIIQLSVGWE